MTSVWVALISGPNSLARVELASTELRAKKAAFDMGKALAASHGYDVQDATSLESLKDSLGRYALNVEIFRAPVLTARKSRQKRQTSSEFSGFFR